jgi:hypothetical protein
VLILGAAVNSRCALPFFHLAPALRVSAIAPRIGGDDVCMVAAALAA